MQSSFGFSLYFRLVKRTLYSGDGVHEKRSLKRICLIAFLFPAFLALQGFHRAALLFDDLLFPEYRKIKIRKPLFIVGLPRSGTTFLQKVLARDVQSFTTFTLWELLFAPSILERKIIFAFAGADKRMGRPLTRIIAKLEKKAFSEVKNIQNISLNGPWEDYFLFFPVCACFLLVLVFPCSEELWRLGFFDDQVTGSDKKRIMVFYRSCLQRHLFVHGKQKRILSKNPSFSAMVNTLTETFPDGQIVACMRNPLDAAPSLISSMNMGARFFENSETDRRFRDQLLQMLQYFCLNLISFIPEGAQGDRLFVTMESLTKDIHEQVAVLYRKWGCSLPPSFENALRYEFARSKNYQSEHEYCLEQFGLQPTDIVERFEVVFEKFGYKRP